MRSIIALSLLVGCASSSQPRSPGPLRFLNRDPIRLVNDRKPTPPPAKFDDGLFEYYFREDFITPTKRALTMDAPRRAANVNSLGEVPNSVWFTNRSPTPDQIRRGPGRGGPDRTEPWRVVGVKVGGVAIGITIEDARHDRYLIKFDERNFPETESAADVIAQRLTWAFGYNVPDNEVTTFRRDEIVLDPKAEIRFRSGDKQKMTEADLEEYLGMVENDRGTFRALASKLIGGKIVGGVDPSGVRKGDLNDRVPHELRRDLRGQRLLWAWLDHTDIKSQNTLATYTDDKYVMWYALDFGAALGVGARTTSRPALGSRKRFSLRLFFTSLVTFGLHIEPWERLDVPALRGLGWFQSEQFDPATWTADHYWPPIDVADRFDELWAAEILMRFSRAHIEAAVAAGRYSDPRTATYVVNTLVERQRKIGRYAFSRVAPLSQLEVHKRNGSIELCFDDLWLRYAFGAPASTTYRVLAFDYAGRSLITLPWQRAQAARTCITGLPEGPTHDGYTIVGIDVGRAGARFPPVYVHVARGPHGPRVVGIDRR